MIVRMIGAVMLVVVDVDVSSLGGGGGSTTPGECIVPANTETVSVKLRAATAPIWRNLRTFVALRVTGALATMTTLQTFSNSHWSN